MVVSISTSVIACLKLFNSFIEEIRRLQEANVHGLVTSAWEDELGRLRMWAANIGAHRTGQSSLDFRLKHASHVHGQILELLRSLLRRLNDARDVLAEVGEADGQGADEELIDEEAPKTEIQDVQKSLITIINCLFQMSILVRRPAQHDVYLGSKVTDVAAFEHFDYNHVREKFPRADEPIIRRLGAANTRRRAYLKYRERHAIKLRQGINDVAIWARDSQNALADRIMTQSDISIISDTVATNYQIQNIELDDKVSDTSISQTSYASTLVSGGNVTIPSPPENSLEGAPFECPYCFYPITVHGINSWNKHVYQDLQPYLCIITGCASPNKLYSTRHEWQYHVKEAHQTATAEGCIPEEINTCTLCKDVVESGSRYDRHLARHMQELALFILPRSEEGSDLSENNDNTDLEPSTDSVGAAAFLGRQGSKDSQPSSPIEYNVLIDDRFSTYSFKEWLENVEGLVLNLNIEAASRIASEKIRLSKVKSLMRDKNNSQVGDYGNGLQAVSHYGNENMVNLFLEAGADVNDQGGYYGNALQAASQQGHEKTVKLLLRSGANVNAQGGYYGNALQAASRYGHENVMKLLLESGMNVKAQIGYYGNALQAASRHGNEKIVRLLLDAGADVNAQGGYYENALQAASRYGHENVVKFLLASGADVDAQGGYYGNALQAASYWGNENVVRVLLKNRTHVNAQGGLCGNALQAASNQEHENIVKLLLEAGAKK